MQTIEKYVNKYLGKYVGWNYVVVKKNNRVLKLTFEDRPNTKKAVEDMIEKLPQNIGCYQVDSVRTVIMAPIENTEQQLVFAEECALFTGQELVKIKKQTIERMQDYENSLKKLLEAKRQHKENNAVVPSNA
jgi:hypothetical protein